MEIKTEIKIVKYIECDGIKFYGDQRGYWLGHVNGKRKHLHIYVWEKYNGEIPKGYHIHHIDHNKDNNDIDNLLMLTQEEHLKLHGALQSNKIIAKENLNKYARPEAIKWHKTEEAREMAKKNWHSSLGKGFESTVISKCEVCGKEYEVYTGIAHKSKFCSNACKSKWRRINKTDIVEATCLVCGNKFTSNKYKGAKTCSKECRSKLLLKNRNGIEWQK